MISFRPMSYKTTSLAKADHCIAVLAGERCWISCQLRYRAFCNRNRRMRFLCWHPICIPQCALSSLRYRFGLVDKHQARHATYVITVFPAPAVRKFSKIEPNDSLGSVLTNPPAPEYRVFITVHPKTKAWMAQQPLTGFRVVLGKYVSLLAKVVIF